MKVLFAIKEDNGVIASIEKKFKQDGKTKFSYNKVESLDAITKELQKNSYNRIVVSEDFDEKLKYTKNTKNQAKKYLKKIVSDAGRGKVVFCANDKSNIKELIDIDIYNIVVGKDKIRKNIYDLLSSPISKEKAIEIYGIAKDEKAAEKKASKTAEPKEKVATTKTVRKTTDSKVNSSNVNDIFTNIKYLNREDLTEDKYVKRFDSISSKFDKTSMEIIVKSLSPTTKKILRKKSDAYNELLGLAPVTKKVKDESEVETKRRGRPRKEEIVAKQESTEKKESSKTEESKRRGRPRKENEDVEIKPDVKKNKKESNVNVVAAVPVITKNNTEKKKNKKEEKPKEKIEEEIDDILDLDDFIIEDDTEKNEKQIPEKKSEKIKDEELDLDEDFDLEDEDDLDEDFDLEDEDDLDEDFDLEDEDDLDEDFDLEDDDDLDEDIDLEDEDDLDEDIDLEDEDDLDEDIDLEDDETEEESEESKEDEDSVALDEDFDLDDEEDIDDDEILNFEDDDSDEDFDLEDEDDIDEDDILNFEDDESEDEKEEEEDDDDDILTFDDEDDSDDSGDVLNFEDDESEDEKEEEEDDDDILTFDDEDDSDDSDDVLNFEDDESEDEKEEAEEDDDDDILTFDDEDDSDDSDDILNFEDDESEDKKEEAEEEDDDDILTFDDEDDSDDILNFEDDESEDEKKESEEDDDDDILTFDDEDDSDDILNFEDDESEDEKEEQENQEVLSLDNEKTDEDDELISLDDDSDDDIITLDDETDDGDIEDDLKIDEDNDVHLNSGFVGIQNKNYSTNSDISKTINEINEEDEADNTEVKNNIPININEGQKVIAFVGGHGNGTSFIVNNMASLLSEQGINVAILDATKNKNSYYIYTENQENLRGIAFSCFEKLNSGISDGIKVNKNLTVYTSLPNSNDTIENKENALNTILSNNSLVLIDCDVDTDAELFEMAEEIYLIQSLDILTIQPLTSLLKKLKMNHKLDESKLRIIINKDIKVNELNDRILISAMSVYNSPDTTYQLDLFNRDTIQYLTIPFEERNYCKYLGELARCKLKVSGYSKSLINSFNKLAKMIYPIGKKKK